MTNQRTEEIMSGFRETMASSRETFIEKLADLRSQAAKEPNKEREKLDVSPGVGITAVARRR